MHGHHPAAGGGAGLRAPPHAVAARAQPRRLRSPRPGLDRARRAAQWWFPLLVMVAIVTLSSLALFQRALVPMMMEQMEQQAQNGQMSQDKLDRMERTM